MTETKKASFLQEARGIELLLRPLRGILTLVLCSVPLIPLFALLIPLFWVLRPVNPTLWARITAAMSGYYYFYWMIIIEYVAGFKVVISGDELPFDESALLISNHVCAMDPFFQFCIAARRHRIGHVKFFAKEDIKMYFPWGPAMALVENIFIGRRWVEDDAKIASAFACLYEHPMVPVWLVSFLEGGRLTPKRLQESKSFAKKNGLPELDHCLYPRVKGFEATIRGAGDLLDAVYDVTLAYNGVAPTVYEFAVGGFGAEVNFHIKRIPLADVPKEPSAMKAWLYGRWQKKDKLLREFARENKFPDQQHDPLSIQRWWPNIQHGFADTRTYKGK